MQHIRPVRASCIDDDDDEYDDDADIVSKSCSSSLTQAQVETQVAGPYPDMAQAYGCCSLSQCRYKKCWNGFCRGRVAIGSMHLLILIQHRYADKSRMPST